MALVSLVFAGAQLALSGGAGSTSIGALTLDALLSEGNRLSSRATRYPVESGTPITDNISRDSEIVTISGVVTSASVQLLGLRGREKLVSAKAALRGIYESETTITIITGLDAYTDMVMESCDIDRKVDSGGELLDINCRFVKIRKAMLVKASLPPARVSSDAKVQGKAGATKQNAGKASTTTPTEKIQSKGQSILKGLLG